jgi:hypothetical protein
MKLLSIIIAAAALSGAAYAGSPWFDNFQAQMAAQEQARQVHEQLEEIQAQQRQIRSEIYNQQLFEEQRCRPMPFWVRPLELECE